MGGTDGAGGDGGGAGSGNGGGGTNGAGTAGGDGRWWGECTAVAVTSCVSISPRISVIFCVNRMEAAAGATETFCFGSVDAFFSSTV